MAVEAMTSTDKAAGGDSPYVGDAIRIRGARAHNLQNVDVDIPRDRLVVMTGPSGSGKSSLAFDTLYAEGQRQYIESLSVYARQFIHQMERPEVDLIDGLQPTICIDQRPGNANPRSTVATVTEIYDYLRLLMARVGEVSCFQCGQPICQQTPQQIQEALLALPEGTKAMILAPLVQGRRGKHEEAYSRIRKAGFVRARVDGQVYDIDRLPELHARQLHHVDAVVDRVIVRDGVRARIADSLQLAIRHGEGVVIACCWDAEQTDPEHPQGRWQDRVFSTRHACPHCNISLPELEPRTFSFNSPYGACPQCGGLGRLERFDPEAVVPDAGLSLSQGAVAPWKGLTAATARKHGKSVEGYLQAQGADADTPLDQLDERIRHPLLHGDGKRFAGVLTMLEKQFAIETHEERQAWLAGFRGLVPCPGCQGSRLRPEANAVRVAGRNIHEICRLAVSEAAEFFATLQVADAQRPIADPLVAEIVKRLEFLIKVGADYLALDRPADTLSGGERQRVRLATSIGSALVGVCYILDEPSIGLHPRDNRRLIDALRDLQRQGNTVLVVEHDEAMMREADQLIDVGPAAGSGGGHIVAQGTPDDVIRDGSSLTARYLRGELRIPVPATRRRVSKSRSLIIEGAATNNLQSIDVQFPLGLLVCVTGVSGSGKSSLVNATLGPALIRRIGGVAPKPGPFRSLRGTGNIDKVIQIDQAPIGRTPRSTPATYIGAFDEIRKVFANTREAKQRGYRASRFSFNVKGGRCDHCQGHGLQKIEMNFLPDLYVTCSECQGTRFGRQTLEVRYRDKSIADVLQMPVDEAAEFFENFSNIHRPLESFRDIGLGYLSLGQPSTTLSGGEAQRIKLAAELARVDTGKTLYLLDEPTTGLHFDDIRRLLDVLGKLVDRGNTVIVIEHNLEVIKSADWIVDLGPEGGRAGGRLMAAGPPEAIAALPDNHTGRFLRPLLNGTLNTAVCLPERN
jgi:excinuclease ABC subunit A